MFEGSTQNLACLLVFYAFFFTRKYLLPLTPHLCDDTLFERFGSHRFTVHDSEFVDSAGGTQCSQKLQIFGTLTRWLAGGDLQS